MTADDEKTKESSFTVVDKRRFDTSGHERTEESLQQAASTSSSHTTTQPNQQFIIKDSQTTPDEEPVAFTSFIMSLATQVLMQLGEMPAPSGMEIPIDREAARQTIDILSMLQKRTHGNVSQEEAHFFEDVLHSLRISYLNKKAS